MPSSRRTPQPSAESLEDRLRAMLSEVREVDCAYLFGSTARGDAGPMSDVDVAVLPAEIRADAGPPLWLARLVEQLERDLGRNVQIVLLDEAPRP